MKNSISLIMPAYNEEENIEFSVRSAQSKFAEHGFDYEILIFNDASTDKTGKIADKLAMEDPKIKVFHNEKNMNLGFNFAKGIDIASKKYAGLLPCHGLIALESFDSVLQVLAEGNVNVIIGYIANPKVRHLSRRIVSWINTTLLNMLFGFGLRYYHLNFYRTELLKKLPKSTKSYALMVELLVYSLASGATYREVPFYRIERGMGKSKALRVNNLVEILKTYIRLFWRIRVLREKIDLKFFKESE